MYEWDSGKPSLRKIFRRIISHSIRALLVDSRDINKKTSGGEKHMLITQAQMTILIRKKKELANK